MTSGKNVFCQRKRISNCTWAFYPKFFYILHKSNLDEKYTWVKMMTLPYSALTDFPPFSKCPSEEIAPAIWLPALFSIFWLKKRTKWKGDSICIGLAVSAPYNHRLTDGLSFYIEREQIVQWQMNHFFVTLWESRAELLSHLHFYLLVSTNEAINLIDDTITKLLSFKGTFTFA